MKYFIVILCYLLSLNVSAHIEESKYSRDDCITPKVPSWSWYGKFAKVEALTYDKKYSDEVIYVVTYRWETILQTHLLSKNVENHTIKAEPYLCYQDQ